MAWYNASWNYRQKLTLDTSELSSSVTTDHAVLVKVDANTDFWDNVQSAGQDVRFTSADGTTLLDYHFEKFVDNTQMIAWVEVVDTFDSSTDTEVYMYYGNSGASDDQDEAGTYTADVKAVYHMTDGTDGTGNYDATVYGASTNTDGKMGGCYSFDGNNDYLLTTLTYGLSGAGAFAFSFWVYSGEDSVLRAMFSNDGTDSSIFYENGGDWNWASLGVGADTAVLDGAWHMLTVTVRNSKWYSYVDGVVSINGTDVTGQSDTTPAAWKIASYNGSIQFYKGKMDEIKIFDASLSDDEAKLLYLSESDTLITFGSQESNAVDNDFFTMSLGCNF